MPEGNGRVPGVEARAGKFPGPSLIPALHALQREHGWLPREQLVALARDMRRPLYEIEGLVSFYPHFRTAPPDGTEVAVCRDLSCRLARTSAELPEGAAVHEVSCVGRCDRAPVAIIDEHYPDAVTGSGPRPNDPYGPGDERYRVLRSFAGDPVPVLEEAGLRGMGGAGFPTGRKWDMVRGQAAEPKYVICNADEAEPGTFKDRQILAEQPHLVIEGMLIAMRTVGAQMGWVFIRHEYEPEERVLRAELDRARAAGALDGVVIDVFTSPGGYILGEETALIECMEGHRGEPRNKPPFPGGYGLHGLPTLMNNVETFAAVPIIIERGAEWWKSQGVNGGSGLKFFSVSGHVESPGVFCVPAGTTVGEVIELAGGVRDGAAVAAVQPGGASTDFLGPDCLDVPLTFDAVAEAGSALGTGAMAVIAEGTDLLAAATDVLAFFRNESCGKCVPCRVGSHKAHTILREVLDAGGGAADVDGRIDDLEETLRLTSICGLGQVALGPVMSVLRMQREHAPAGPPGS
jgi:NADH:ubiquinone oxidoreductase subunit F (NADH-binding)/NADH:ubiquinone oxidoreductase subunit E